MTAKKQPDFFRLAELQQMRLRVEYKPEPVYIHICQLCTAEAEAGSEIQHAEWCPLLRLK